MKKFGARAHPGSGSGKIQFDGSTEDDIIEVKTAAKQFVVQLSYIERLYRTAVRMGKTPWIVLHFPGYEVKMQITRR